MSIFFEILVRIASYGPQIDQLHGENRLSHIVNMFIPFLFSLCPLRLARMLNFNISKVGYLSSLGTEREKIFTSGFHF